MIWSKETGLKVRVQISWVICSGTGMGKAYRVRLLANRMQE